MAAEDNAKTLLSPYATGNGFDTWKRMMRIRVHQAKLQRTNQLHRSDPKLATELTKSQEKLINQNSNKLLVAKSSVTLRGGNGSWTLGSTASSPKRQVQQYGRVPQPPGRTPIPVPPPHSGFPNLTATAVATAAAGHNRTRTTPTQLLPNTRGLVILSDNIHARTRRRIQRYTTAKKRQVSAATTVAQRQEQQQQQQESRRRRGREEGGAGENARGEEEAGAAGVVVDPYASCHMLLLPLSRTAAKARCQEEVDKFSRIVRWLEDCKEAMADGDFEVELPDIKE